MMRKSVLTSHDNHIHLSMPISKIDEDRRLVSGFASLDNSDTQGDIVKQEASLDAFHAFHGNIREMHQSIAAGRMIKFEERMYYDQDTEKFYNGIYVTAYISTGAQPTWEKVLDGTLSGFSIGGGVLEFEPGIDEYGNAVRIITKYFLNELSLVDNPANQLAKVDSVQKIFSIRKSDAGTVVEGISTEVETKTIFFCPTENIALVAEGKDHDCTECGSQMENIGWCESSSENVMSKMQEAVTKRLSAQDREGGAINKMTEQNKAEEAVDVTTAEEAKVEEADAGEQVTEEEAAAAEPVVEGEVVDHAEDEGDEDLSAILQDFQQRVLESIEAGHVKHSEQVDGLRKELTGIEGKFGEKLDALEKSLASLEGRQQELDKSFKGIQSSVSEVEKSLEVVDSSTALKKSVDTDPSAETIEEPVSLPFGGAFLNSRSI